MSTEPPDCLTVNSEPLQIVKPSSVAICAEDGRELLTITVTGDGHLDVSGDEGAWTEGAARFVAEVRRMLGAG